MLIVFLLIWWQDAETTKKLLHAINSHRLKIHKENRYIIISKILFTLLIFSFTLYGADAHNGEKNKTILFIGAEHGNKTTTDILENT